MKKLPRRPLALDLEAIRQLAGAELRIVVGGQDRIPNSNPTACKGA